MKEHNKLKKELMKAIEGVIDSFELVDLDKPELTTPGNIVFCPNAFGERGIVFKDKILRTLDSEWIITRNDGCGHITNLPVKETTFDKLEIGDVFFRDNIENFRKYKNRIENYSIKISDTDEISWRDDDEYPISIATYLPAKVIKVIFD